MSAGAGGLRPWLAQRLSAAYLTGFVLFVAATLLSDPPDGLDAWGAWVRSTPMAVATALFFLALLVHAWVGVRNVVIDYVRPTGLRLGVLSVVIVGLLAQGLWVLRILFGGVA